MTYNTMSAKNSYVSTGGKSGIFVFVFIMHCALVVLPMIFFMIQEKLNPPIAVMKVSLVDFLPGDIEQPTANPGQTNPEPINSNPSVIDTFSSPADVSEIPDVPELIPEPKQQPVQESKVTHEIETVKISEPAKKIVAEPEKKQNPQKKTYLRPEDIKVNTTRSTKTVISNTNKNTQIAMQQQRNQANAELIKSSINTGSGGGNGPAGVVTQEYLNYYDKVQTYIYPRWNQPPKDALGSQNPEVVVQFKIDKTGKISGASILKKSGIRSMDASVEALIRQLTTLPVPPKEMDLTVTLRTNPR